jgi:hypothetical protein
MAGKEIGIAIEVKIGGEAERREVYTWEELTEFLEEIKAAEEVSAEVAEKTFDYCER